MWRAIGVILAAVPVQAESLLATRNLPPQTVLTMADLQLSPKVAIGAMSDPKMALGKETRVAIYLGHPIRDADIGPPTLVERNAMISLEYRVSGLHIQAEGRALARGGAGDDIRAMNLRSKTVVSARIGSDGRLYVGAMP